MAKPAPARATRKRVFVVDDHPLFRDGLGGLVKREADLTVCGEAADAARALAAIERLKPDLLLVDIGLPGRSGLELIKDVRAVRPDTTVLVVSMHDEALYAERVLRAGAHGYIMKQEGPDKMLRAIRHVLEGQIYLSRRMSERLIETLAGGAKPGASPGRLTDRELEILELLGQGRDSHDIARQLQVSRKTVDAHRGNIKEKLKLRNHTELISYAARWAEARSPAG